MSAFNLLHHPLNIIVTPDTISDIIKKGDVKYLEKIRKAVLQEHQAHIRGFCGGAFECTELAVNDRDDVTMLAYLNENLDNCVGLRTLHKSLVGFSKPLIKTIKYILFESNREGICKYDAGDMRHVFFNTFGSMGNYSWGENTLKEILRDKSMLKWFLQQDLSNYPSIKNSLENLIETDPFLNPKKKKVCIMAGDLCTMKKGDSVVHQSGKTFRLAKIIEIHYDAYPQVYYTIDREDGRILQTTHDRIFCIAE